MSAELKATTDKRIENQNGQVDKELAGEAAWLIDHAAVYQSSV